MRFFFRLITRYNFHLETNPYRTQALTAGSLWFCGDILSQALERYNHSQTIKKLSSDSEKNNVLLSSNRDDICSSKKPFDWQRAGIMSLFGFVVAGPLYSWWYSSLDRVVGSYFARIKAKPGNVWTPKQLALKKTGVKLVADLFIFDPPYLVFFFASTSAMSGMGHTEIFEKLRQDVLLTYAVDVAVWAPIQAFNFSMVRVAWQPVVVSSVNIFWNAYLSYVKHRPTDASKPIVLSLQSSPDLSKKLPL